MRKHEKTVNGWLVVTAGTAREVFEWLSGIDTRHAQALALVRQFEAACAVPRGCGDLPLQAADVVQACDGLMARYPEGSEAYEARYGISEGAMLQLHEPAEIGRYAVFLRALAEQADVPEDLRAAARQEAAWLSDGLEKSGYR